MAFWRLYKFLGWRHGMRCTVLCRGPGKGPLNELIEFEDGGRVVVPRYSVQAGEVKRDAVREGAAVDAQEWMGERAAMREYFGGAVRGVAEVEAWVEWMREFPQKETKRTKAGGSES